MQIMVNYSPCLDVKINGNDDHGDLMSLRQGVNEGHNFTHQEIVDKFVTLTKV